MSDHLTRLRAHLDFPLLLSLLKSERDDATHGYIHAPERWKSRLELYELAIAVLTGGSDAP